MATGGIGTNSEKQCRLVLLLTRAGGEMLRGLVMDSVSASGMQLDGFLQAHHFRITHMPDGRKRKISWAEDVLFPPDGSRTDINKWELNVLCFIVLDICVVVGNLHPNIIDNVEDLKSMRNKVCHAADMTNDEYDKCTIDLENIVLTCCRALNNGALLTRVEAIVKSIKDDPLSFRECERILTAWNNMQWEVTERLTALSHDHKEINGKLDFIIQNLCPKLKPSGLQFEIQIKDSQKEGDVAAILVEMISSYRHQRMRDEHRSTQVDISPPDAGHDEEHTASEATGVNTIVQEGTSPEESSSANVSVQLRNTTESKDHKMTNVKQQLEMVLNEFCIDGTVIINCYEGSVHLVFQCSSFTNIMNKIAECVEGKTTQLFNPVQTALRQLEGCEQLCLDVMLMETWYWECIKQIVECVEKSLQEALQTVDSVENMPPEPADKSDHARLYLTVKSTASFGSLENIRKRCCSDEMKQKITGLTEALKRHLEIENLALEVKVHTVSLQDAEPSQEEAASRAEQPVSGASTNKPVSDSQVTDTDNNVFKESEPSQNLVKADESSKTIERKSVLAKPEIVISDDSKTSPDNVKATEASEHVAHVSSDRETEAGLERSENVIEVSSGSSVIGKPRSPEDRAASVRQSREQEQAEVLPQSPLQSPLQSPQSPQGHSSPFFDSGDFAYEEDEMQDEGVIVSSSSTRDDVSESCPRPLVYTSAALTSTPAVTVTPTQSYPSFMKSDLRPDLVPITKEVSVPFDVQTCYIGHGSRYIHWLMDKFDVDINISPQKEASNIIQVTAPSVDIQRAELALAKTQVVTVDLNIHPRYFVQQIKEEMNWISLEHDVGFQLPEIGGKDQGTITIIGYEENCKAARVEILQKASDLVSITKEVSVLFDINKYSTGIGNTYLDWLMDKFNVDINIPPRKEASNIIQVTGTPANVQRTEDELAKTRVFTVDLNIHPKIIKRRNDELIKYISRRHDVWLQLPGKDREDQSTITIIGYEENCKTARVAILRNASDVATITKEVSVPFDKQKYSTGIGKTYLDWLMNKFTVDINILPQKEASNIIQVTGTPVNVQRTADELAKTHVFKVDLNIHPRLITWCTDEILLKMFSRQCDVWLQLPGKDREDQGTMTFIGYEENCKAARVAILQTIDLESITKEVSVLFDINKYSTGIGKTYLDWLMDKFYVDINIPPRKEASNIIQVTGTPANVQRTEDELAKTRVFTVDLNIHPKIITRRNDELIKDISRKHDVWLQLPGRDREDQGTITIIGYEENCKAARVKILQKALYEEERIKKPPSKKLQTPSTRFQDDEGFATKKTSSQFNKIYHDHVNIWKRHAPLTSSLTELPSVSTTDLAEETSIHHNHSFISL